MLSLPAATVNTHRATEQVTDQWGVFSDPLAPDTSEILDRVLDYGPSGLRVGGLKWQTSSPLTNVGRRLKPVVGPVGASPALGGCDPQTPQSLADHFVDELFPAAQVMYCTICLQRCSWYMVLPSTRS